MKQDLGRLSYQGNKTSGRRGLSNRFGILTGLLCLVGAVSANASSVFITGVSGVTAACAVGNSGTLTIDASGGLLLEAPSGTAGCYVGGYTGTAGSPTPSGTDTTFIGGLLTEGIGSQLSSLITGWYAEFGAICGGTSQCTASNSSTNGNTSGDIEVLVNSGGSAVNFQVYDNTGTIDSIFNLPSAPGCGANGTTKTFTVAADTVCIEDMSTSGSISMTIGTPATTTPEPSSFSSLLIGGALLCAVGLARRRRVTA